MTIKDLQFNQVGNNFKLTHIGGIKIKVPFTVVKLKDEENVEIINKDIIQAGSKTINIHNPSTNNNESEIIWFIEVDSNTIRLAKIGKHNISIFAGGVYTFQ